MLGLSVMHRWLSRQYVLSYCVADQGELWCANVFYLYDLHEVAGYFFSDPQSRHGRMAGQGALVAGTVSGQPKTIEQVRGVQFLGELSPLDLQDYQGIVHRFLRRFPQTRTQVETASTLLWQLRFTEIKFTDNSQGFGKKFIWRRDDAASSTLD